MLEEINIRNCATYGDQIQSLAGLKTINFLYGANASGKTTIGRIALKPDQYAECQIEWHNGIAIERFVYNTDFVSENFKPQMAGIFTLGAQDAAILNSISDAKKKNGGITDAIVQRRKTLFGEDGNGGKQVELLAARREFEEHAWAAKAKYDEEFQDAFAGVRNAKSRFADKLFQEFLNNSGKPRELSYLQSSKSRFSTRAGQRVISGRPSNRGFA